MEDFDFNMRICCICKYVISSKIGKFTHYYCDYEEFLDIFLCEICLENSWLERLD